MWNDLFQSFWEELPQTGRLEDRSRFVWKKVDIIKLITLTQMTRFVRKVNVMCILFFKNMLHKYAFQVNLAHGQSGCRVNSPPKRMLTYMKPHDKR